MERRPEGCPGTWTRNKPFMRCSPDLSSVSLPETRPSLADRTELIGLALLHQSMRSGAAPAFSGSVASSAR